MFRLFFIILTVFISCLWVDLKAQCNSDLEDAKCLETISKTNTFVKSYKLTQRKVADKEFSSVLAKNTHYYLNLCEHGELSKNVVINVYNTKRKLIASNKTKNDILPELSFKCDKTGVYYFEFKASESAAECGIGALSFRR